jgi:hypothetical protein
MIQLFPPTFSSNPVSDEKIESFFTSTSEAAALNASMGSPASRRSLMPELP